MTVKIERLLFNPFRQLGPKDLVRRMTNRFLLCVPGALVNPSSVIFSTFKKRKRHETKKSNFAQNDSLELLKHKKKRTCTQNTQHRSWRNIPQGGSLFEENLSSLRPSVSVDFFCSRRKNRSENTKHQRTLNKLLNQRLKNRERELS